MYVKNPLNIPCVIYSSSLFFPVFERPGETVYGIEVLVAGWLQVLFGITSIGNLISHAVFDLGDYLFCFAMIIPWLGNAAIVAAISYARNEKVYSSKLFSMFGLICGLVFWIKPIHSLGSGSGIAPVEFEPLFGAYLWTLSLISMIVIIFFDKRFNKTKL